MPTCMDCYYFKVCRSVVKTVMNTMTITIPDLTCENFKDKSKIIDLPCDLGSVVYVKMGNGSYVEAKVVDFSYFSRCVFCVTLTSHMFNKQHIPFTEFGKTVFLKDPYLWGEERIIESAEELNND